MADALAVPANFFGIVLPLVSHLGLLPGTCQPDGVEAFLPWKMENTNARGDVHGGVLMAALDLSLSAAARVRLPGAGMATIDMNTQFLLPAQADVRFRARCLHLLDDTAYCEGAGYDARGRMVVKAAATFRIVRGEARSAP